MAARAGDLDTARALLGRGVSWRTIRALTGVPLRQIERLAGAQHETAGCSPAAPSGEPGIPIDPADGGPEGGAAGDQSGPAPCSGHETGKDRAPDTPAPPAALLTYIAAPCRYPIGDPGEPGFVFCGRERRDGSSYCAEHHELCHVRVPERRSRFAVPSPWGFPVRGR